MQFRVRTTITCSSNKQEISSIQELQHAVVTNKKLVQYKIKDNDKCSFCTESTETLTRLFCECHVVLDFYNRVLELMNEIVGTNHVRSSLTGKDIILNNIDENPKNVTNFIFLIAKHCL